jgi:general secretion pathway protein I
MRGFTLLEILVALAVVAIALLAVQRAMLSAADQAEALRARLVATWVAQDRLAELRLSRTLPPLGTAEGRVEQGGRAWAWRSEIGTTPNPAVRRVEIEVMREDKPGHALAQVVGYLVAP